MNLPRWIWKHPNIVALGAAFVLCILVEGILLWRLRSLAVQAQRHRALCEKMREIAEKHKAVKGGWRAIPLSAPGRLAPETVSRIAQEKGLAANLSAVSVSLSHHDERTQERTISLTLNAVRPDAVARFLAEVERLDPAFRVRELRLTANPKQPSLYDAKAQVSAHEAAPPK